MVSFIVVIVIGSMVRRRVLQRERVRGRLWTRRDVISVLYGWLCCTSRRRKITRKRGGIREGEENGNE